MQTRGTERPAPTCLDDELSTFITREEGHVDGTAFHVGRVFVHDGIQLRVAHCGREREKKAALRLWLGNNVRAVLKHSIPPSEITHNRLD